MTDTALNLISQTRRALQRGTAVRTAATNLRRKYAAQVATTETTITIIDLASLSLSAALVAFGCVAFGSTSSDLPSIFTSAAFVCSVAVCFRANGLNKPGVHPVHEVRGLISVMAVASLFAITHLHVAQKEWHFILALFPVASVLVPVARSAGRIALSRSSWWGVRCLVFGANRRVESLYKQHCDNTTNGLRPVGFLQDVVPQDCSEQISDCFLGRPHRTRQVASTNQVACALVHRSGRADHELHRFIDKHLHGFARIVIVHDDARLPSLWSSRTSGYSIEDNLLSPTAQTTKRVLDVSMALVALVVGFPFLAFLTAWIKSTSKGQAFFGHSRIGQNGRRFTAWKFRSMVTNATEVLEDHLEASPEARAEWDATQKLQNDPRVTLVGRFLRKTSLDELPQLWNVLKGDMSLVGPRPIVVSEIKRYKDSYQSYLRVRPGITGLWQVSGRNLTTYERRVELDEFYVRNWSLSFDFYILCRTVKAVLFREGAY